MKNQTIDKMYSRATELYNLCRKGEKVKDILKKMKITSVCLSIVRKYLGIDREYSRKKEILSLLKKYKGENRISLIAKEMNVTRQGIHFVLNKYPYLLSGKKESGGSISLIKKRTKSFYDAYKSGILDEEISRKLKLVKSEDPRVNRVYAYSLRVFYGLECNAGKSKKA